MPIQRRRVQTYGQPLLDQRTIRVAGPSSSAQKRVHREMPTTILAQCERPIVWVFPPHFMSGIISWKLTFPANEPTSISLNLFSPWQRLAQAWPIRIRLRLCRIQPNQVFRSPWAKRLVFVSFFKFYVQRFDELCFLLTFAGIPNTRRNLNYNMIGGTLPDSLPWTFTAVKHLGLAHCSAGLYAPELSWLQDPSACNRTTPNPACSCTQSSYKKGSTNYTLSGTIPASWGSDVAPWRNSLTSV